MAHERTRRSRLVGDADMLIEEIERAVRDAVSGDRRAEDVDALADQIARAVRDAVSDEMLDADVDALVDRVSRAVRREVGSKRLADDIETLINSVNRTVRVAVLSGSEAAESMGRSLKDRIQVILEGVRGSGRDSVVMVRVNADSRERMDELIEADLVGSRSEAAAFLIAEGIKARQELFDRISSKIDDIRRAKAELQRLLDEQDAASV